MPSNPQQQQSSMSSPPSPLVWFLLLDSATGQPYKGSTADKVSVSSSADVADFRDAVKAKYDQPTYLKDIPSGALLVYKNKTAFGKRNAAVDEGKEEPLEEDSLVDGLGTSKKEALVVVVPSSFPTAPTPFPKIKYNFTGVQFPRRCMTLRLDSRLSSYEPDDRDDIKLLIGPSGCGKTRTCFELLHKRYGFFFSIGGGLPYGSNDIDICMSMAEKEPGNVEYYIQCLIWCRWNIIKQLIEDKCTPAQVLLAQLYPIMIFKDKIDPFANNFSTFAESKYRLVMPSHIDDLMLIVDEVQEALSTANVFKVNQNPRPFFSPMLKHMKNMFKTMMLSGTGIDYNKITECIKSCAVKRDVKFAWQDVNNFPFLNEPQIFNYSQFVLKECDIAAAEDRDSICEAIGKYELCRGRARLCAFVLDGLIENPTMEVCKALERFRSIILNRSSPCRLVRFLSQENGGLYKVVNGSTFHDKLTGMFINYLVHGTGRITTGLQESIEWITKGIGFRKHTNDPAILTIELAEPAVVLELLQEIPLASTINAILDVVCNVQTRSAGGKWFEYLVAYTLLIKHQVEPVHIKPYTQSLIELLEEENSESVKSQYLIPDDMCGPDVIWRSGRDVWIVQIKRREKLGPKDVDKAAKTTLPKSLYTNRSEGTILKGYRGTAIKVRKLFGRYNVHRLLVSITNLPKNVIDQDVEYITPESAPDWFDAIHPTMGEQVWGLVCKLQPK